jgi:hypothetical protein
MKFVPLSQVSEESDATEGGQTGGLKFVPLQEEAPQAEAGGSDFMRGLRNVPGQIQETYGSAKTLAGLLSGNKETVKSGMETAAAGQKSQVGKDTDSFSNAFDKGIGTVMTDWLPYQIGAGVGNIAETLAFMGIGAVGGGAAGMGAGAIPGAAAGVVGRTLIKQGIKEAAESVIKTEAKKAIAEGATKAAAKKIAEEAGAKFVEAEAKRVFADASKVAGKQYAKSAGVSLGSTAGAVSQAGMHGAGEVTGRAIEEAQKQGKSVDEVELARIAPAAIVHGVADYFVNKIGLDSMKIGEKTLNNLALDIGKRIAVTGTKEVPAEEIQTIAERYGANLSLTDAAAVKEYVDTFAASYAMSVAPSAVGGARTNLANKIIKAGKEQRETNLNQTEEQLKRASTSAAGMSEDQTLPDTPEFTAAFQAATQELGEEAPPASEIPVTPTNTAFTPEELGEEAAPPTETLQGAEVGNETPQTVQAEAQGQEAPAATDVTKKVGAYTIEPAMTEAEDGSVVSDGYDLFINGNWAQRFATKKQATAASNLEKAKAKGNKTLIATNQLKYDNAMRSAEEAPVAKPAETEAPKPKTIADLSEAQQTELNRRKDELAEIAMDKGTDNKLYRNKSKYLANMLNELGVTESGTLSAKRTKEDLPSIVETPDTTPAYKGTDLAGAMEQAGKVEKREEEERQKAYEESLGRTPRKYDISEDDVKLYNDTRDEVNKSAEESNAKRSELIKQHDDAAEKLRGIENQIDDLPEGATAEASPEENKLQEEHKKALSKLLAAEAALNKHGPELRALPEYTKNFPPHMKDVYFGNITQGGSGRNEHRKAAKILQEYLRKIGGSEKEDLSSKDRIKINHYEENRAEYSKLFGLQFPRWQDLTQDQKKTYDREVTNNAGIQQDVGFAKLGVKIIDDNSQFTEGQKREQQNTLNRKEEVRIKSLAQQAKDKRAREAHARAVSPFIGEKQLPNAVIDMVMKGDAQGVLQYLTNLGSSKRSSPYKKIQGAVAKALGGLKLNTKIKLVDSSKINDDLAQYDPKTDTILISREGLSDYTLLHEFVHAGTIKVINEYLYGDRKSLTPDQIRGVRRLQKIMELTSPSLAAEHPEAYKNLFEFVGYALTDKILQDDLRDASVGAEISAELNKNEKLLEELDFLKRPIGIKESLLPKDGSAWSEFKTAVAGIINFSKSFFTKNKKGSQTPEFLMETFAAFDDILAKPTEPIFLPMLSAKEKKQADQAEKKAKAELHVPKLGEVDPAYALKETEVPEPFTSKVKEVRTINGWQKIARTFQDDRYPIKNWERIRGLAGLVKGLSAGKNYMNNIYEQIVLSTSDARNFYHVYIEPAAAMLDQAVGEFAKGAGYTAQRAVEELHKILEAVHEPERRMVKYLLSVPLKPIAAARREQIIKLLDNNKMSVAQAKQLRIALEDIVLEKDAKGEIVLGNDGYPKPNMKYVDPLGSSSRSKTMGGEAVPFNINFDAESYNATGIELNAARDIRKQLETHPQATEIKMVMEALQKLHQETTSLNKLANYWSQPVSNRVAFYGFGNYVPLKGKPNPQRVDEDLDFDTMGGNGKELQESPGTMDGRFSVSNNPILQTMTDATRAAMRAGRRNLTQAIKNSLDYDKEKNPYGQNALKGYVKQTIKFEERNTVDLADLKGETTIFHYNEDGSIDILVVQDEKLRNSIRRSYKDTNVFVDYANKITSGLGQMHTRYNYQFAPMNFVRDTLANAWNISASEIGPVEAARYLKDISTQVVGKAGLYKAMQVAMLYKNGDEKSLLALQNLSDKDPYIRDMVEVARGAMVSHMQGISLKSNFDQLNKSVGRSGIVRKKEDFIKLLDTWTDMFELASRGAAYGIAKSNFSKTMNEEDAKTKALVFTKNLANFEQVGEWGKGMGAMFMFFRPSATGAVRAIEAFAPAFMKLSDAVNRLPPEIATNETAKAEYIKNFKQLQKNARISTAALTGMGMMCYFMAQMFSDDDDLGRNAVATDNMDQWTRYGRWHIPRAIWEGLGLKKPLVFQTPWGFGGGAFAAAGAQAASVIAGSQPLGPALINIGTSIAMDSFMPIPVSRISLREKPLSFFIDSITPSFLRPIVEFSMNTDGLGRDINSTFQRRLGDAYTGKDSTPEAWKDAAVYMHDATDGGIDISPSTLHFFTNSYIDGIARIGETAYGLHDLTKGHKDFDPKTDIPLLGSFFGTRSNYDARQFTAVETKIKNIEKVLNTYKDDPDKLAEYKDKHPTYATVVKMYNTQLNQQLNPLRAKDNKIRRDKDLSPSDKASMLRENAFLENSIKNRLLETFKDYDVEP